MEKLLSILQDMACEKQMMSAIDDDGGIEFNLVLPKTWFDLLKQEVYRFYTLAELIKPEITQSTEFFTIQIQGCKVTVKSTGTVTWDTDTFFKTIYDKLPA